MGLIIRLQIMREKEEQIETTKVRYEILLAGNGHSLSAAGSVWTCPILRT